MGEDGRTLALVVAITTALGAAALGVLAGAGLLAGGAPASLAVPATCTEWTDGCVLCARTADGLACSTPGIACVRAAPRCVRR